MNNLILYFKYAFSLTWKRFIACLAVFGTLWEVISIFIYDFFPGQVLKYIFLFLCIVLLSYISIIFWRHFCFAYLGKIERTIMKNHRIILMRNGYIENIKKIIQLQDTDKFIFVVGMDLSGDINTVSDVGTACALREYLDDEYSCDNTKKVSDEINHQLTLPSGKREYNYGDCKLVNLNLKKNGNCSEPPRFITIAE